MEDALQRKGQSGRGERERKHSSTVTLSIREYKRSSREEEVTGLGLWLGKIIKKGMEDALQRKRQWNGRERKHSSTVTRRVEVTGLGLVWLGLAPLLVARPRPEPFGRPLLRPVPRWGVGGGASICSISPIVDVV